MCQPDTVKEARETIERHLSPSELHEVDIRVGAKLAEREILRSEYVRGICDCFYAFVLLGFVLYVVFFGLDE